MEEGWKNGAVGERAHGIRETEHMAAGNRNSQSLLSAMYLTERCLKTQLDI